MQGCEGVVWEKGEPVRLSRAHASYSNRRPKLCSDTLFDLIAVMECSDGAAKHAAARTDNGAASEIRVVVEGSCPFVQVAGSGQFLRKDSGSIAGSGTGPFEGQEAHVQAGARKSEDERLLDELKALRLQVLGLGAQEAASN